MSNLLPITRNTMRADGLTVGEAMDRDAAFLRSVGVNAPEGAPTFYEQREERTDAVRKAVLAALDETLGGKGWIDSDLPELFRALDAQISRWEARQAAERKAKVTPKELEVLRDIVTSEYQDGDPTDHDIWLDYVIDSKSRGGVLTSLKSKGLVEFTLVSKANSSGFRDTGITESIISITAAGFAAYKEASK